MKILVKMTNWVGDCLIATPAIRALKRRYPQAQLSVLVQEPLKTLFAGNPHVEEVIGYRLRRGLPGVSDRLRLARQLRERQFDRAYIFPRSWDSALVPFLARIPTRIGYASGGRRLLLTQASRRTRALLRRHQSHYYWNLVEGNPDLPPSEQKADLILPAEIESWAEQYFQEHFAGKKVVGIAPGATYGSAKMWLPERYRELAERLLRDPRLAVIFFGGSKEAEWMVPVLQSVERAHFLAGKTTLAELAALMKRCRVIVTNDSGPMHVASAVGAPLVALFGPTRYENTHPLGPHTAIHKRVACSPCMLRHCPIDHRCMTRITVDEVYKEVRQKLI